MIIKFELFENYTNEYIEYSGLNTSWNDINIKDVLKYLDDQKTPTQIIDPNKLKHLLIKTERDPKRIDSVDLQYPLIVSMKNGKFKSILDGQHRLVKALKYKLDKIKIRVIDLDSIPNEYKIAFENQEYNGKFVNVNYKIFHQNWKDKPLTLVTDFKIHKIEGNYIEVIGKGYEYKDKKWVPFDDYETKNIRKFPKKSVKDGEKRIKVYDNKV